jgi:hypothetical protein
MTTAENSGTTPSSAMPSGLDLRQAARATLLIRSAKLICQSGEYVCLVRDVSASGVRLRLFHALPPETYFFLAMANGEIYPMENRWTQPDPTATQSEACQAGFRFAQPIDVDAFIEEAGDYPRRPIRLSLECHGQLFSDGRNTPMVLRNISQGGAQVETTTWLALHQTVRLVIDGLPERFAQIRWRNRYDHGLAFDQAFRLDELATHARMLQPFVAQPSPAATEFTNQHLARASA